MSLVPYKAVVPVPSIDSGPFWAGCNEGKLLLQRCKECERRFYYARRLCPFCGGDAPDWVSACGRGTLFSVSEVHTSFFGPDWDDQLPYTVALIDLEEGPRMLSRLVLKPHETPHIGDPVHVVFVNVDGQNLPFFEL